MDLRHKIERSGTPHRARRGALLVLAGLLIAAPAASRADVYVLVQPDGTTRFSNAPDDPRYVLFVKEPTEYKLKPTAQFAGVRNPGDYRLRAPAARRPDWPDAPRLLDMPFHAQIREAARANEVDPALVHALIAAESNYNPKAVSEKGAIGLMQVMPDTGRRYGMKAQDLYAPPRNIAVGVRYLAELIAMFDGNLELAIASYNAGENAVIRFGNRIPPYPETQAYVPRVMRYYAALRAGSG
ncbi:MAG: lytic transglycosylase domain-containing protein [Burkholderiales bacterium]|nr:lytic transglycosylase domain-containing protein [Burkholderiales bacterium]